MRHHGLKSQITNYKLRNSQSGYMLITLMLALTLITIALLAAIPNIRQQVTRDREEEMTHRGTAYMRAIQHFYKKFNRYPNKIEELENTNNVRFLRRRYTDPMNRDPATGKERDFKFLHQQDVMLNSGPVLPGGLGQNGLAGLQGPGGTGGCGPTAGIGRANRSQQRYQFSCGQLIHWEPVERQSECAGSVRCQSEWNIQQRLQRPDTRWRPNSRRRQCE